MKNKIDANDRNLSEILDRKFYIDYFQREYCWEEKHMKSLIEDITNAFFKILQSYPYAAQIIRVLFGFIYT